MIGGNIWLSLEIKSGTDVNELGEQVEVWKPFLNLWGWLDLSAGSSNTTNFNAKIAESSHVFICDYQKIAAKEKEVRAICEGALYDVDFIDDPMNLHEHLEIFLSKVE